MLGSRCMRPFHLKSLTAAREIIRQWLPAIMGARSKCADRFLPTDSRPSSTNAHSAASPRLRMCRGGAFFWRSFMKTYRLITFAAALLITVFIARALADKKAVVPLSQTQDQVQGAAEQAP